MYSFENLIVGASKELIEAKDVSSGINVKEKLPPKRLIAPLTVPEEIILKPESEILSKLALEVLVKVIFNILELIKLNEPGPEKSDPSNLRIPGVLVSN